MTKNDKIYDILIDLDEDEIIGVNNDLAQNAYDDESFIYYMHEFDDIAASYTPSEIADSVEDFHTYDDFFSITCYGFESFSDVTDKIDFEEMADYMVDNMDSCGISEIEDILDEEDEDEEDEDDQPELAQPEDETA